MPCRNQGYILDGFPKTYDQAKDLFNQEDEEEEEEVRGKMFPFDKLIIPGKFKIFISQRSYLEECHFAPKPSFLCQ